MLTNEAQKAMEEQSPNKHPEKTWLEKGTEGLCASFNEPLGKTKVLQQVCEKQIDLADRVASENEKFVRIEEGLQISHMIEKTASYKHKLESLQREMKELSQRSTQMKIRAARLQEAKQKEALKREQERQRLIEKEELLIARPARSNAGTSFNQRT